MMLLTFIEIVFVDLKLYFRDWAAAFWTLSGHGDASPATLENRM